MKHKISIKTLNYGVLSVYEFQQARIDTSEVVGIVLQTETIGLILALPLWDERWSHTEQCVIVKNNDDYIGEAVALTSLSGLEQTKTIVETHSNDTEMYAAKRCWEYDCAGLQWYLPSLYELAMLQAYKDEINSTLDQIGLSQAKLTDRYHWSSSEAGQPGAWLVNFSNGYFNSYGKYISCVVRAVCAFESLRGVLSTPSATTIVTATNDPELSDEDLVGLLKARGYSGQITKTLVL